MKDTHIGIFLLYLFFCQPLAALYDTDILHKNINKKFMPEFCIDIHLDNLGNVMISCNASNAIQACENFIGNNQQYLDAMQPTTPQAQQHFKKIMDNLKLIEKLAKDAQVLPWNYYIYNLFCSRYNRQSLHWIKTGNTSLLTISQLSSDDENIAGTEKLINNKKLNCICKQLYKDYLLLVDLRKKNL